jgi:hypothetical protein
VAVQEEWETVGCNGRSLRGFAFRGNSVRYVPGDEFSLFLVFPADAGAAAGVESGSEGGSAGEGEAAAAGARAPSRARLCSFIDQFIEDFTYFRGAVGDRDGAPFPAVLQFPGS